MDPHVACTRLGEWTITWSLSSRFVWLKKFSYSPALLSQLRFHLTYILPVI
jgi:hypothetical protein